MIIKYDKLFRNGHHHHHSFRFIQYGHVYVGLGFNILRRVPLILFLPTHSMGNSCHILNPHCIGCIDELLSSPAPRVESMAANSCHVHYRTTHLHIHPLREHTVRVWPAPLSCIPDFKAINDPPLPYPSNTLKPWPHFLPYFPIPSKHNMSSQKPPSEDLSSNTLALSCL